MSLSDGNFDQQALDEMLDLIRASCDPIVFRPNAWYLASGDETGIRFAEIPDSEIWLPNG